MSVQFEQIETVRWPSGDYRAVALLGLEPAELTASCGIVFARELDDLDYHQLATLRLPSGRQIALVRYERSPGPGTEVDADTNDLPGAARDELLAALGLSADAVTWRPDDAVAPAAATA